MNYKKFRPIDSLVASWYYDDDTDEITVVLYENRGYWMYCGKFEIHNDLFDRELTIADKYCLVHPRKEIDAYYNARINNFPASKTLQNFVNTL